MADVDPKAPAPLAVVRGGLAPSLSGRVPPHDLDAETAVLSALLLEPDALDRVRGELVPGAFYSPANAYVYEACLALADGGSPLDAVTVGHWLKANGRLAGVGGVPYLAQLVDAVPSVANLEAYAAIVRERAQLRAGIAACQRAAAAGYGAAEATAWFAELSSDLAALERAGSGPGEVSGRQGFDEALADIEAAAAAGRQIVGLATGFGELDHRAGLLEPQELIVLAARPGVGKSAFAGGVTVNVAASGEPGAPRRGVVYATLEMPYKQMSRRFVLSEAHVDAQRAKQGGLSPEELARVRRSHAFLLSLPLRWFDRAGATVAEIEATSRRFKSELARAGDALALVIVDYLQLCHGHGDTREQEVASVARDLKEMAKRLGVPVMALAQLNREGEDRPQKRHLRESGEIENAADRIYFLHPGPNGRVLIVEKNRDGPSEFDVPLNFNAACARFDGLERGWE